MGILRHRRRPKLRPLDEAEAYARCHGQRNDDVKIVHLEPRRPRYKPHVSGESLREAFERKLDARVPEEALEPAEEGALIAEDALSSEPELELPEALGLAGEVEQPPPVELERPRPREGEGEIAL